MIGALLKKERIKRQLSQRAFSKFIGLSFRQLQRLEKNESDLTVAHLLPILKRLEIDWHFDSRNPDWQKLISFGMPLEMEPSSQKNAALDEGIQELKKGVTFFLVHPKERQSRLYDAFRGLLLALSHHFPSLFSIAFPDQTILRALQLSHITSRDIKFRQLALSRISTNLV